MFDQRRGPDADFRAIDSSSVNSFVKYLCSHWMAFLTFTQGSAHKKDVKIKDQLTICRTLWQFIHLVTKLCSTDRKWKNVSTRRDSNLDTNKPPAPRFQICSHCFSKPSTLHSSHYPLPFKGITHQIISAQKRNLLLGIVDYSG